MTDKTFTPKEMEQLRQNKYVLSVSPSKISYSLEFKQFVVAEAERGTKALDIFIKASFDPDVLGKPRIKAAVRKFKRDAKSPEGLRPSRKKTREECIEQFAKEDYERKHTKTAICELQKRIVHLEQQIEFLKKIQSLDK